MTVPKLLSQTTNIMPATISYVINSQKIPSYFKNILTKEVLDDIVTLVTGQSEYELNEITTGYNKGRLVIVEYQTVKHYISLSERTVEGRNSSLQSVPTALNIFFSDETENKKLYYYFLDHEGNYFTKYHQFIFRTMMASGIDFLNISKYSTVKIAPFSSVDDLIQARSENRCGKYNNSSYVALTEDKIQLFAKTYGANKYESTIIGVALKYLSDERPIEVYQIAEKNLKGLPEKSATTLTNLGLSLFKTSLTLPPKSSKGSSKSLRDAAYTFNLFERLGEKECAACGCKISSIIQGAHILSIADIKKDKSKNSKQKYTDAISGHNGLWLCQNHHKLFDSNYLIISSDGHYHIRKHMIPSYRDFIKKTSTLTSLNPTIMSKEFIDYLNIRNNSLDFSKFEPL